MHIWTIVITYSWFGFFGAAAATFLPFISNIFLAVFLWIRAGLLFSPYTIITIVFFALFIATSLLKTAMMNKIIENDPLERLMR
jgi:hypothetical protein